ncbi:MAG: hypothetical protein ACHQF4_04205 [Sphingobacteriales bacterium]
MEGNVEYQLLLKEVGEKAKAVKMVYNELSKSYPLKDIAKQQTYNKIHYEWRIAAQKFLILYVYHRPNYL